MPTQKDPYTGERFKVGSGEEVKRTTEMINSMTSMLESMSASQHAQETLEGLSNVLAQPAADFKEMLFTPLLEGVYENVSPIIAAAMPMMEDISGAMGEALKPALKAVADLIVLATPFVQAITDFIGSGALALFDFQPGVVKSPEQFWAEAGGGAATGAIAGGLIGGIPGAIIGGIFGFFFGGFT